MSAQKIARFAKERVMWFLAWKGLLIEMRLIRKFDLYVSSCGELVIDNETEYSYKIQTNRGYKQVQKFIDGKRKTLMVHRLVAMAFVSNPDDKPDVNHKDGNKANNHYTNLEWCTEKENTDHAYKNGLFENKKPKDSERNEQMKEMRRNGHTCKEIAKKFGLGMTQTQDIVREK